MNAWMHEHVTYIHVRWWRDAEVEAAYGEGAAGLHQAILRKKCRKPQEGKIQAAESRANYGKDCTSFSIFQPHGTDWLFGFWWFVQITLTAGQERKELEWRGSSRVSTVAELQRQRWLHNNTRIRMIVSILPAWAFGWMRTSVKSKTQEIWANVKRAKVR